MIERTETYYYCEVCGRKYTNKAEVEAHEERCFRCLTFNFSTMEWSCCTTTLENKDVKTLSLFSIGSEFSVYFKKSQDLLLAEKLIAFGVLDYISKRLSNCVMLPKIKISNKIESEANVKNDEYLSF